MYSIISLVISSGNIAGLPLFLSTNSTTGSSLLHLITLFFLIIAAFQSLTVNHFKSGNSALKCLRAALVPCQTLWFPIVAFCLGVYFMYAPRCLLPLAVASTFTTSWFAATIEVDGTVKERWTSGDGNELPEAGLFTSLALKYLDKSIANKFSNQIFSWHVVQYQNSRKYCFTDIWSHTAYSCTDWHLVWQKFMFNLLCKYQYHKVR